jgi:hypothetical protein
MNFDELKISICQKNISIAGEFSNFLDELSLTIHGRNMKNFFSSFDIPSVQDRSLIEDLSDYLIPFIVEKRGGQHDIYCYDFEQSEHPKVVVFADHAFVNEWDSATKFLIWLSHGWAASQ